MRRFSTLISVLLCVASSSLAQRYQMPFERGVTEAIEWSISRPDSAQQTSLKPYYYHQFDYDSVRRFNTADRRYFNLAEVKFLRDHLIEVKEEDFHIYIDAVLDLDIGKDLGDTSIWQDTVQIFNNTRGAVFYGQFGENVSLHATVFENQTQFPFWMYRLTDSLQVIPGQGRFKELESNGRDYNSATGVLSIKLHKDFDLHLGHGKHFIGNGYRSMLLSDVAFSYPFIRMEARFLNGKVNFTTLKGELIDLNRLPRGEVPEALFRKKGFTFNYLNLFPHPRFELGLYEGVIWQRWDSTGTQPYPLAFAIPLPGIAPTVYGLDSTQNVVLGANLKLKITRNLFLYGQYVLDKSGESFTGWQAGLNVKNLPLRNMTLRLEYNEGGQGLYTHRNSIQSYTHMNQGLAHPLGTNFKEYIGILQHSTGRFWSELKAVYQHHDGGPRGFALTPSNEINNAPPQPGSTFISDLRFGYLMNPTSNINAIIGWTYRDRSNESGHIVSSLYYLAFRLALFNRYYDI